MNDESVNEAGRMRSDISRYMRLRWADMKLTWVENLATLFNRIFAFLAIVALATVAFTFFMVALAIWLGEVLGSMPAALAIVGGVFLVLAIVALLLRKHLIINPLVRIFTGLFFTNDNHEKEDEQEDNIE
jgi:hypothetical protein